ncbi:MAG: Crp/Fnr family transcriptional regulator [Nitrospira sp.]|nr:MAG: Crp/Fnr family transcriptional regulator [Nitrospira sp.]
MGRKRVALFDPKHFLTKVTAGKKILQCRKKQILFSQGDAADAVFYILDGKVKLTVLSRKGKEAVITILEKGEFFGEACLTGQLARTITATTLEDSTVMRIDKAAMILLLHKEPTFAGLFMSHLLSRNIHTEEALVDQLFNSSEKRLARILLVLAHFGDESQVVEPTIPKISQGTLAEMIGTTRSRVSFFLNKFRKLGFIDYKGRAGDDGGIRIRSSLLNIVLLD